jgi:nitrogen regulatory protein PII
MFMIMFVSKDVEQASEVLEVWVKAGVEGVTILESAGMQQMGKQGIRDDIGLLFSLRSFTRGQEIHHRTLFSAIKDEATLQQVVDATTKHVGDWSKADVGVLFVWPLAYAYGLDKGFTKR